MADIGVLNIVFLSCGLYPSTYDYHFCQWSGRMSGVSALSQLNSLKTQVKLLEKMGLC